MNAATDRQCKGFFEDLWQEVGKDWEEDETAFRRLEVDILRRDDGTFEVKDVVSKSIPIDLWNNLLLWHITRDTHLRIQSLSSRQPGPTQITGLP